MNYDLLESSYWQRQVARVRNIRDKIANQEPATTGRIVPDAEDLAIGRGRRLKVAVMFLDICAFSRRPSETEAEQELLLRVLNLFFSEMIKIAEDHGGTVEKNTGDGLMAYFEDESNEANQPGPKRAIACALTMMSANDHLIAPILRSTPTPGLEFRISIDYGTVIVARLGAARRFNSNVAIGATANFACKMLSFAQAGEIVISDAVRDRLPIAWNRFIVTQDVNTGWSYIGTGKPVGLHKYIGRWNHLD